MKKKKSTVKKKKSPNNYGLPNMHLEFHTIRSQLWYRQNVCFFSQWVHRAGTQVDTFSKLGNCAQFPPSLCHDPSKLGITL